MTSCNGNNRSGAATTAVQQLAQVACAVRGHAAAQQRAATHLLDWLACAAQGSTAAVGLAMARWLALQSPGPAPTLHGSLRDAAAAAAFHGALGSALEMDDVHRSSVLHPAPVVIPAVLAAAPADMPGAWLLGAIVSGYEVMIRVGRALGPAHYAHWHTTSTAGSFGAAAGVAAVLGLDAPTTAQALALAGTRAGGLWQVRHESSLGKAWHMAGAARDGLAAAQAAAVGVTGPLGVLDGPSGWFAVSAPQADATLIAEARSTPWIDDVSFKPWPACRHAHPAMDALRALLAAAPVRPDQIDRIEVHSYADALRFCDRPHPQDEAGARFSVQHALAAWLLWGEAQLAHYQGPALADATLRGLRQRIHLQACPQMQARYPSHYGARVLLHLHDGTQRQAELHDTFGDPARPMPEAARHAKARMLMGAAAWNQTRIAAALAACTALPGARDLQALHAVIRG